MSSWAQSRELTRQSWGVLKTNRYLLAYPLLGVVACIIPVLLLVPGILFLAVDRNWEGWACIIAGLFIAQAVFIVFQAGLTVSAAAELEGGSSSLGHGLGTAMGRFGRLFRWAIVSTLVGLLIGLVRGNGNSGVVESIFRTVLAAAAGVMWQLITFFVMPAMMLDDLGMVDAIKKSASTFKQRWGTQLSGGVRIGGLLSLLVILPAMIAVVAGAFLTMAGSWAAGVPIAVIGVIVLLIGSLLLTTMRGVFSVVLYRFATQGVVAAGFTEQQLAGAVRTK